MSENEQLSFEFEARPTIKGFPELRWTGKRPYRSTQYYPAQIRESCQSILHTFIHLLNHPQKPLTILPILILPDTGHLQHLTL